LIVKLPHYAYVVVVDADARSMMLRNQKMMKFIKKGNKLLHDEANKVEERARKEEKASSLFRAQCLVLATS
jgi:hypothetical protein